MKIVLGNPDPKQRMHCGKPLWRATLVDDQERVVGIVQTTSVNAQQFARNVQRRFARQVRLGWLKPSDITKITVDAVLD